MKHSLKPTLYTFIPIIIIFGWLNANLAFMPIAPDADFSVSAHFKQGTFGDVTLESDPALIFVSNETQPIRDGVASWTLRGDENKYSLKFSFENTDFFKELIISSGREYANSQEANPDKTSALTKVVIHNKELKPLGNISIFGWRPGWLGTYIVLSLIFSIALRKLLKIS